MACSNVSDCPCTVDCPRHAKCCECVAHHRDHEGGIPGCFFTKEGEASGTAAWKRCALIVA